MILSLTKIKHPHFSSVVSNIETEVAAFPTAQAPNEIKEHILRKKRRNLHTNEGI